MGHVEVIQEIAKKTGISQDVCDKIVKAFEEVSGSAVLGKLTGGEMDVAGIAAKVSEKTGLQLGDCTKVLEQLGGTLDSGVLQKLGGLGGLLGKK